MAFENPVKVKLARGEAVWGASAMVADPFACQLTIDTGIDFLWIDTEHAPIGPDDTELVPVLARQRGCSPMIRVAGLDSNLIKKSLDAGASTIMVPQVNNADEARAAVISSLTWVEGFSWAGLAARYSASDLSRASRSGRVRGVFSE